MMGDSAPAWFSSCIVNQFEPFVKLKDEKFEKLSTRLSALETKYDLLRDEPTELRAKVDHSESNGMLVNQREIKISVIPVSFAGDHTEAVAQVFQASENEAYKSSICSIRVFNPPTRSSTSRTATPAADLRSLSLVVKLKSAGARDEDDRELMFTPSAISVLNRSLA